MQAIILATDEQPTLRPLTELLPGPLLPIVDRPVMATSIELLARSNLKKVYISLFNRGGPIAAYFGSGSRWGVEIEYLTQRESWGDAGSLKWAGHFLEQTFLVLPGDAIFDLDIEAALAFHQSHGGIATAILSSKGDPLASKLWIEDSGIISTSGEGEGTAWPTGAFIFEPSILEYIPSRSNFAIIEQLLPALAAAQIPVYGYTMEEYWNSLHSLQHFHEAQQVFLYSAYTNRSEEDSSAGPSERIRNATLSGRQVVPGVWVGLNHSIHPSVKLAAPVHIGDNIWIGREVELGAGTVIGNNVVIDDEATVSGSTVFSETYVGQLVRVENRIVTANSISEPESGETVHVVDPFLLSHVGVQNNAPSRRRRTFSTIGAAILLIVHSPLLLVLWLINLILTGGKPLVQYQRASRSIITGPSGSQIYTFDLLRFRTKWTNGRYTLLGRWLERREFHRLPELFSVLKGDLELVGVKPLSPEDLAQLQEEWHQKRNEAPAGFTGLWYEQTEPDSDLDTIIVADVYYIATRTWHGDLGILLRTPKAWFRNQRKARPTSETAS